MLPMFLHRTTAATMKVLRATAARKKNSWRCHFSCKAYIRTSILLAHYDS